jgi:hypothetical protein
MTLERRHAQIIAALAAAAFLASSCSAGRSDLPPSPAASTEQPATETPPPPSLTPTVTSTATPLPSSTPTQAPRLRVAENTNCRSGPGVEYLFQGALKAGEVAEVVGRSAEQGYWFVTGPGLPPQGCWLTGELAEVEGETDPVPIYTAAPSPTPQVGFTVGFQGFERCGPTFYIVYAIKNVGGQRIWSGYVEVQDHATGDTLYRAAERHPFAATVLPVCPPDHGNELWPGETRYIHAPLSDVKSGSIAIGIITLCTADHQGGACRTEYSYVELP